ncbi:MAG TPA: hypothetical protein VK629_09335 [Steroidobacteraceae bacterium]|nr:hypothetical protein [Steroidobacteraceae bacterium]
MGRCVSVFAVFAVVAAGIALGKEVPISVFAKQPQVRAARLSPDGTHLLIVSTLQGQATALVVDTETLSKFKPVMTVKPQENVDIAFCQWGNNTGRSSVPMLLCCLSGHSGIGRKS